MWRRLWRRAAAVSALLLLVGCGGSRSEPSATAAADEGTAEPGVPLLRIEPAVSNVVEGQRTWAQVRLAEGSQARGVTFEVTFDPRYVRVEDSVPDAAGVQIRVDTLCDPPLNVRQDVLVNEVDNEEGLVRFESTWSGSAYSCADAVVASIDVRGLTEGGCPLRFATATVVVEEGEISTVERPGNALVLVAMAEGTPQPVADAETTEGGASSTDSGDAVYHTVRDGETVSEIAGEYGTTVEAIAEANDLDDPDSLSVGQRLRIPDASAPSERDDDEVPAGETDYVIQPGDTLSSIAQRLGTTVEALAELNDIEPPYTITAGDTLRVR